ncbi:sugar ABC transporter substrate-binding protein [Blautia schinkii]|nr:sugar ABC transporter substrate-binding protein [Blautia schinkii]
MGRRFSMRKTGALILAVLFIFSGCSAGTEETPKEPLRAAIFYRSDIWVQDINIMRQIADSIEKNLTGHYEVALSKYGTEGLSVTDAVNTAIDMQTDVLIFYSINSETALESYRGLKNKGIQLLLVDGDLEESGRFAYIGTDNYTSGQQANDAIVDTMGTECCVAVLSPALETTLCSVNARLKGFEAAAEASGLIIDAYCETSYDSLTAIERVKKLLDTHPDVEVLYCTEAVSGQAAADVVHARGLDDEIMVITYDINESMKDDLSSGALDLTLAQNTEEIGKACAEALIRLAHDRSAEKGDDVYFDCTLVASEDLKGEETNER